MRRLAFDNKADEQRRRRNRYRSRGKGEKQEVHAAVKAIREDTDPLTVEVKKALSARKMAEAEYAGIEFVRGEEQEGRAIRVLQDLWPFNADSMIRRLEARGIVLTLAE
jgi:DNA-dependent RNA polymerase auxiliary subunit epsilon